MQVGLPFTQLSELDMPAEPWPAAVQTPQPAFGMLADPAPAGHGDGTQGGQGRGQSVVRG